MTTHTKTFKASWANVWAVDGEATANDKGEGPSSNPWSTETTRRRTTVGRTRSESESGYQSARANVVETLRPRRAASHKRTSTHHGVGEHASSAVAHPLQPPSSPRSLRGLNAGVTRPTLERWLSGSNDRPLDTTQKLGRQDLENGSRRSPAATESLVQDCVHKVLPTDSLAGVALRYGVTIADLRKVNKLWASDSIHMRKVLYIPLDWTNKKRQAALHTFEDSSVLPQASGPIKGQEHPRTPSFPGPGVEGVAVTDDTQSLLTAAHHPALLRTSRSSRSQTLRQVSPMSQSLNSSSHIRSPTPPSRQQPDKYGSASSFYRTASPALSHRSIAEFLSSFQLPFPSADGLISRISLDSTDTESLEQDHEMDVIKPSKADDSVASRIRIRPAADKHRAGISGAPDIPNQHTPSSKGIRRGDLKPSVIRTEQMRPSPRMQLPTMSYQEAN